MAERTKAPWHLWVIGLISLMWNGFGAMDYARTQMRDRDYVAGMSEPFGIELEQALAYFEAMPLWVDAAWAVGVWGAVLGSVLLLLRKSTALHAFAFSLGGMVVSAGYQIAVPMPGMVDTALPAILTGAIFMISILLLWYALAMRRRGVLR